MTLFPILRTARRTLAVGALAILATVTRSSPAEACGGFWCSQSAPVNQTAEQIIFVDNPDATVTCVVQIAYAGPAEKFAWLLPVGGIPEIGVSSNIAFERLGAATRPTYRLIRHVEGQCELGYYGGTGGSGGAAYAPADGGAAGGPVQVLDSGSVGPYDYTVISVDRALSNPADVAIDWLTTEGYDVVGVSSDVLGPYLADGMNLVAFRLTKGNSSGSIRPVVLTYSGDRPSIPIRPTAVAAQDDMGIQVWVLADHQAVPQNYRSLVLNEALINWFNPLANYDQVVTTAANEAGGQGFVTEFAGGSAPFQSTIFTAYEGEGWSNLQQQAAADPLDLIWTANNYFRGWDGWRETIETAVQLPPGATYDDFGRDPEAYRDTATIDAALFLETLYANVIEPVERTQELVASRPYLTRLYSTMSADEMTVDPVFTVNADLAPVSNVHEADMVISCEPGLYEWEAPWRIVLPQGGTLTGEGSTWPLPLDGSMPANRKVVQLSETGSGEVVTDNSVAILSSIVASGGMNTPPTLRQPSPDEGMVIGGPIEPVALPATEASGGGCGCSLPGRGQRDAGALAALGVVALLGARRTRRGAAPRVR